MKCPKCGSEEWKLASVVYAGGLSSTSSTGVGVGAHGGSDIGLGGGIGSAKGKQQTELSKMAAPPTKRKSTEPNLAHQVVGVGVIAFGVGAYFFGDLSFSEYPWLTGIFFKVIPAVVLVALLILLADGIKDPEVEEEHRLALLEYEKKKMCLRCGDFYVDNSAEIDIEAVTPLMQESAQPVITAAQKKKKKCPYCAEIILAEAILCKHCRSKLSDIESIN